MQKTPTTTRNLPEPKCHLRNIRNIRGSINSGLGPRKMGVGNLPVIPVFRASNNSSALQLARTEMSPAGHTEHSRKWSVKDGCRNVRIVVILLPSSELMLDKSMWVMSAISPKSSANTKRPQSQRVTASWPCSRRMLLMIRMTSPVNDPARGNQNIRGSIVSGLVRKRRVRGTVDTAFP